jgi:hypothetical protein
MKRTIGLLLTACVLLMPLAGCKFLKHPEYTLQIILEDGVWGIPAEGTYTHYDLDEVDYSYGATDTNETVEVLIDDGAEGSSSSLVIYHDTVLYARLFDPRGPWYVTSTDSASKSTNFDLVLEGSSRLAGTFLDSRGYHGTWTAKGGKITLTYGNWEKYVYSGNIPGMGGTWANGTAAGTWGSNRGDAGSFRWKK